jgi:hypothetical protein
VIQKTGNAKGFLLTRRNFPNSDTSLWRILFDSKGAEKGGHRACQQEAPPLLHKRLDQGKLTLVNLGFFLARSRMKPKKQTITQIFRNDLLTDDLNSRANRGLQGIHLGGGSGHKPNPGLRHFGILARRIHSIS